MIMVAKSCPEEKTRVRAAVGVGEAGGRDSPERAITCAARDQVAASLTI
jgi:hypothetical protein